MRRTKSDNLYDTRKANLIALWDNRVDLCDPNSDYRWLYRSRDGRWFVHGHGYGPEWCRHREDGTRTYGQRMVALNHDDAKAWMEGHQVEAEVIERYFPTDED